MKKTQIEKSDVEWLIGLISTWAIALIPYIKTRQKPLNGQSVASETDKEGTGEGAKAPHACIISQEDYNENVRCRIPYWHYRYPIRHLLGQSSGRGFD